MKRDVADLALTSLVATLAIQIYTSFASSAPAVLAPVLAHDLDITPKWIGVFVGLVYAGAMTASLLCGTFIRRLGAIRISQICVLVSAAGICALALLPAHAAGIAALVALLIGAGYGPITPASSHILAQTTPAHRMSLVFSIKQTGVPAGAALGGAILPALALAIGWRAAFIGAACIGIAVALFAQPIRESLDADRQPGLPFSFAAISDSLSIVARSPQLSRLVAASFAYSAAQVSLISFLVVFLTESLGWTLVSAGLVLTLTTLAGVTGRIGWGALADRNHSPRRVLALIGLLAAAGMAMLALAKPSWPPVVVILVAIVSGASAIGWNGVQLAEVARHAPPGKTGAVTGASGFITFFGVVVGPPTFAVIAGTAGGYPGAFALLAVLALAGAAFAFHNS